MHRKSPFGVSLTRRRERTTEVVAAKPAGDPRAGVQGERSSQLLIVGRREQITDVGLDFCRGASTYADQTDARALRFSGGDSNGAQDRGGRRKLVEICIGEIVRVILPAILRVFALHVVVLFLYCLLLTCCYLGGLSDLL